ncbi:DUF2971 domain-containing protein [Lacinutrix gracilariae]|uniref:DUF2971 domain-containing protein n=1 Tax=Lacinutrix gracilariae TaxID=1747198 RepID=A0ABW5K4F3_9FLAO
MLQKSEIEKIITNDLVSVLNTKIVYQFSSYEIALEEIILKQSLKFSNPETFNDPFDCNEKLLKVNIDKKNIANAFAEIQEKYSRQKRREMAKKLNDPNTLSKLLKSKKKDYKLSCFSKIYNEVLMWSHYANKHNGICVGFDFPHLYPEKFILCPVKYLNEIKLLDGETNTNRILLYWLTTKSERWIYEQEIRAIAQSKNNEDSEFINYDKDRIKEIIFGCNVKKNEIDNAMSRIKKSELPYDKITFKKMIVDSETFLLKDEIIKPSA